MNCRSDEPKPQERYQCCGFCKNIPNTALFEDNYYFSHHYVYPVCVCMFMGEDNYLSNNYIYPQYGWTHTHAGTHACTHARDI